MLTMPNICIKPKLLAATTDQRVGEILRIMRILHAHENAKDQIKGRATEGATGHSAPDAYAILGVDPQASGGEIKKRYWRLSLLIHPDKCSHPQAPIAFAAVAVAAQQLQDASGRASVDKTREENELMQFTANFLAKEERERQWRTARGEQEQPRIPSQPARTTRESWMTEVPPAFLGKSNDSGRIFTDVKADNHPSPTLHAGARSGASLMEKHQASLAREKKAGGNRHQADDWDKDLHPWRPFDRTKDLEARTPSASKPGAATDFVSATTKLSSRFAPGR